MGIRFGIEKAMDEMTDAQLGAAVREFIEEANHGGWDGWEGLPKRELRGMLALLRDLTYWLQNCSR
jgi:hypothetical protein